MKYFYLIFSSLKRKKLRTVLTILSIMVAFILFGYLTAIRQAFDAGVEVAGVVAVMVGDNNAIVLRSGADSEMMSGLGGDETRIIAEAPGIARDASGAIASPELFVIINLPMQSTGTDANVPVQWSFRWSASRCCWLSWVV